MKKERLRQFFTVVALIGIGVILGLAVMAVTGDRFVAIAVDRATWLGFWGSIIGAGLALGAAGWASLGIQEQIREQRRAARLNLLVENRRALVERHTELNVAWALTDIWKREIAMSKPAVASKIERLFNYREEHGEFFLVSRSIVLAAMSGAAQQDVTMVNASIMTIWLADRQAQSPAQRSERIEEAIAGFYTVAAFFKNEFKSAGDAIEKASAEIKAIELKLRAHSDD